MSAATAGNETVNGRPGNGEHAAHADHHDPLGARIGMWLFLFTEVLLFGALFLCYAVYLDQFTWQFREGSGELNVAIGTVNTLILLTSSLTMALSIAALQRSNRKLSLRMLDATLLCGLTFLVIKAFEWGGKFSHGIYPGSRHLLEDMTSGENVFFGLYYTMTGLHALHILAGVGVILFARFRVVRGRISAERIDFLENTGLYWHLVDLIWIYLFPLFYLIG
jgi:cytochrome c oxidase subunit 3